MYLITYVSCVSSIFSFVSFIYLSIYLFIDLKFNCDKLVAIEFTYARAKCLMHVQFRLVLHVQESNRRF